jgi:hypothetical protein
MDNTNNKILVVKYVIWMEKSLGCWSSGRAQVSPLCIAVLVAAFYWLEEYPSDTMANRLRHKR